MYETGIFVNQQTVSLFLKIPASEHESEISNLYATFCLQILFRSSTYNLILRKEKRNHRPIKERIKTIQRCGSSNYKVDWFDQFLRNYRKKNYGTKKRYHA